MENYEQELAIVLKILNNYEKNGLNYEDVKSFLNELPKKFKIMIFKKQTLTYVNSFNYKNDEYLSYDFDSKKYKCRGFGIIKKSKYGFERLEIIPIIDVNFDLSLPNRQIINYYKKTENEENEQIFTFDSILKNGIDKINFKKIAAKNNKIETLFNKQISEAEIAKLLIGSKEFEEMLEN